MDYLNLGSRHRYDCNIFGGSVELKVTANENNIICLVSAISENTPINKWYQLCFSGRRWSSSGSKATIEWPPGDIGSWSHTIRIIDFNQAVRCWIKHQYQTGSVLRRWALLQDQGPPPTDDSWFTYGNGQQDAYHLLTCLVVFLTTSSPEN